MKWLKRRLERWFLRKLALIDPIHVFTASKEGVCYIDGQRIGADDLRVLQSEVKFWRKSQLCQLFSGTLRKHAYLLMFENSESFEDMRSGKMTLHVVKTQENILAAIEKAVVIRPKNKV